MPKKVVHMYPKNFQTIVLEKLVDFSESIKGLEKKTEGLAERTEGLDEMMRQVKAQLTDMAKAFK